MTGRFAGPAARVTSAALYNITVAPIVLYNMPVLTFLAIVFAIRFLVLVVRMIPTGEKRPNVDSCYSGMLVVILSYLQVLDSLFFFIAATFLPFGILVVIRALAPVITLFLAALRRRKPPRLILWACSVVCLSGAVVAYRPWTDGTGVLLGYIVAVLGAFANALTPFVSDALLGYGLNWKAQLNAVTGAILFVAFPTVAVAAVAALGFDDVFHVAKTISLFSSTLRIAVSIILCAISRAFAGMLLTIAYSVAPDLTIPALAAFSEILFGIIVQITILNERATRSQLIGSILVSLGLCGVFSFETKDRCASADAEVKPLLDDGASTTTKTLIVVQEYWKEGCGHVDP
ncbi:hypothetical protein CTAYLR_005579 [Chrysophaeum taylorii]|uniref:EamA domain-containing protein n=1 Tax=Chrysophaeum taylorii TaxID=2483200 RepID=A0AAD7U4C3_9STRA|nr:hypothetical protein CTAYLR_005579 [Chrysophaeum taylorii]